MKDSLNVDETRSQLWNGTHEQIYLRNDWLMNLSCAFISISAASAWLRFVENVFLVARTTVFRDQIFRFSRLVPDLIHVSRTTIVSHALCIF